MPKISVIVPVYNSEKYLHRCIDSILAQTFTDFEVLLIDDGSTDSSGEICDEYAHKDSRVRVFHKENGGVSSARNLGLDNAKGEWISFVDSDDWLVEDCYSIILQYANISCIDLITTDLNIVTNNEIKVQKMHKWTDNKHQSFIQYLSRTWLCPGWILVRARLFMKEGMRFPEKISVFEDFHLFVRLIYYAKKIINIATPLYYYRCDNDNSATRTINEKHLMDNFQIVYSDIIRFFNEQGGGDYVRAIYSRILYSSQAMVLDCNKHKAFIALFPEKKKYISQCKHLGIKMKIMMWCLTHHMSFIVLVFCYMRNLYNHLRK